MFSYAIYSPPLWRGKGEGSGSVLFFSLNYFFICFASMLRVA